MRKVVQQTGWVRGVTAAVAVCLLLVAGLLVSLTVFLNGQGLRQRVEAALSHALGRSVSIDSLQFSIVAGSAVAHGLRIAEDPRFGAQPFVQAADVRLGLALWPLLSRRAVEIGSVELRRPQIRLLRDSAGVWNYSTFASSSSAGRPIAADQPAKPLPGARQSNAVVAVSRINVVDGQVLVRITGPDGVPQDRLYSGLEVRVRQFDIHRAFPFLIQVRLPAEGAVQGTGIAGPFGPGGTAATPVTAHVTVTHLDLAAAGLVKATSRVTGQLKNVSTDLSWNGNGLHVLKLTAESPALHVGVATPTAPGPARPSVWRQLLPQLQVDAATVRAGTVLFDRRDGSRLTARACDVVITHWIPAAPAGVTMSADIAGGSVRAAGTFFVAPRANDQLHLTTDLRLKLRGIALSGLVTRGSPLRGTADADLHLVSDGGAWTIDGHTKLDRLVLAHNGEPSPAPVLADIRVEQHTLGDGASAGSIQRGELSFGGASVHATGAYRLGEPATMLDLNVIANKVPIDGVESYLPIAGLQLPEKSRLSGGTLSLALMVRGTPADLTIDGPVHADSTRLDGFDLGGKLASLARFTGGRLGSTGNSGTAIRSIGFHLHTGGGQTSTDNLVADVAGVGKLSGGGSVGEGATLHYNLVLRLEELTAGVGGGANLARAVASGLPPAWAAKALGVINSLASGAMRNGIPLLVGGTAKHPTITPNLGALLPAEKPSTPPAHSPWGNPQSSWPGTQK